MQQDITNMIIADTAEPEALTTLVKQSVPVYIDALNQSSIADYYFTAFDGHTVQVNRTQAGELLGNIDSFEDELRRYYPNADEIYAIIEGLISPYKLSSIRTTTEITLRPLAPPGSLYTYGVSDKGYVYNERMYNVSNKMYKAWLLQLDKAGITVITTVNIPDTASTLVAMYHNMQKQEHSTLNRYFKPRINIKEQNRHVQALINLSSAYKLGIGEKLANLIIDKFGSLFNVMIADPNEFAEIEGIGKKTIDRFYEMIERSW